MKELIFTQVFIKSTQLHRSLSQMEARALEKFKSTTWMAPITFDSALSCSFIPSGLTPMSLMHLNLSHLKSLSCSWLPCVPYLSPYLSESEFLTVFTAQVCLVMEYAEGGSLYNGKSTEISLLVIGDGSVFYSVASTLTVICSRSF